MQSRCRFIECFCALSSLPCAVRNDDGCIIPVPEMASHSSLFSNLHLHIPIVEIFCMKTASLCGPKPRRKKMFKPARKAGRRRIRSIRRPEKTLKCRHAFEIFMIWYMTAFLAWHQPCNWYIDRRTRNRMMHMAHGNGPKGRGKKGAHKGDSKNSTLLQQDTNPDDQMDIAEQVRMVLPETAILRAQSVLLQEDWSAEEKPPRNLDAGGGVSLTAKNLIPEIIRRVGWTSHACAMLTVQPPSELGLLGCPRQRVQCRISVMTETGERKEIMIQRWLIQLGYGQPVVQKMQGELVSMFATVKSCIAKFSPRFGWPVGQIGASIAANEIFK